ncbi:thiamine-phosphate kinase [Mycobacterium sp. MYCO198283]|uniref:thiamine-phosphate kinase n=1 Tax=Mycobacterium sp. MYCO198283 TaxID=2883505 RepID=UPI001E4193F0|nr:thiamine-phosphate kinase [Mycobacterium sp. MYCO198283]MCG5433705.1 thiamine-phosphate kinase [Mycobacterium sp. MYCO198283]
MSDEPTLADLGEFGVIDRLVAGRRWPPHVLLGPGDDAAVVAAPDGRVVVSTDTLVAGRHFRLDWSAPHDVGRKAIAQNAADIEAMGAHVTAFVVGLAAPPDTPVAVVTELADGMWSAATELGAAIVGGDLVGSPALVVSVTVLGDLAGRAPITMGGAKPGDAVAVAGTLGRSAAGLALWRSGCRGHAELRRAHLVPTPPYGQGVAAADAGATAMTDVSDGLVADLRHLAAASGVRLDISRAALAPDVAALSPAAADAGADPWEWVLAGGEDHALAATFPGEVPAGWRVVGAVLAGPAGLTVDGVPWDAEAGWQSFGGAPR